jgi:hypothetical protein
LSAIRDHAAQLELETVKGITVISRNSLAFEVNEILYRAKRGFMMALAESRLARRHFDICLCVE